MQTIPRITVRKDDQYSLARFLRNSEAFNTHGNLRGRRDFEGFGEYVPFDETERDEIMSAQFLVYSYGTPIAVRTKTGAWVKNLNTYSTTTSNHQDLVFSAINLL